MKLKLKNCRRQTVLSHLQIGTNKSLSDLDFSKKDLFLEKAHDYKFFKRNSLSKLDILVLYWDWIYNINRNSSEYILFPYDLKLILNDFITFAETDDFCKGFLEKRLTKNWRGNLTDISILYDASKDLVKAIKPKADKKIKSLKGYSLYTYEDRVIDRNSDSFDKKQKLEKYKFNWIANHIILNNKFNTKLWSKGIYLEKLKAIFKPELASNREKYRYDYLTYLGLKNYLFNESLISRRHAIHDIWETRKIYKEILRLESLNYEEEAIKNTIKFWKDTKDDNFLVYDNISSKWGRDVLVITGNGKSDVVFDSTFYNQDELGEITTFEAEEKNAIEIQTAHTLKSLREKVIKLYSNLEMEGLLNENI